MGAGITSLLALTDGQVVRRAETDLVFAAVQQNFAKTFFRAALLAELDVDHREVRLGFVLQAWVPGFTGKTQGAAEIIESAPKITRAPLDDSRVVVPLVLLPNFCPTRRHQSPGLC